MTGEGATQGAVGATAELAVTQEVGAMPAAEVGVVEAAEEADVGVAAVEVEVVEVVAAGVDD